VTSHEVTAESLAAEFPAWEAWQGIDRLWHARIRGATPPVMVHGEDLVDLRDQIKRQLAKTAEYWESWSVSKLLHRPEGNTL
jgi:hypothetical protein